jgi:hypothetical protein
MSNEHVHETFQRILRTFEPTTYRFKCRHCGVLVDMSPALLECSSIARDAAIEVMTLYGTLCDACYESQESVR